MDRGGLEEIARFAVTAASLSTQHPGGIPSIPELAQVVARMGEPAPSPYESPLLFPLPFRVIISHSVLKEVALCPSKRKDQPRRVRL